MGSHYGLVSDYTYEPHPDYFTLLAWKTLMGTVVLNANSTAAIGSDDLRIYAHCARGRSGAVAIAFINVSPRQAHKFDLQIDGSTLSSRREEYLFSAPDGNLL